jgi:hypothetical protein
MPDRQELQWSVFLRHEQRSEVPFFFFFVLKCYYQKSEDFFSFLNSTEVRRIFFLFEFNRSQKLATQQMRTTAYGLPLVAARSPANFARRVTGGQPSELTSRCGPSAHLDLAH